MEVAFQEVQMLIICDFFNVFLYIPKQFPSCSACSDSLPPLSFLLPGGVPLDLGGQMKERHSVGTGGPAWDLPQLLVPGSGNYNPTNELSPHLQSLFPPPGAPRVHPWGNRGGLG